MSFTSAACFGLLVALLPHAATAFPTEDLFLFASNQACGPKKILSCRNPSCPPEPKKVHVNCGYAKNKKECGSRSITSAVDQYLVSRPGGSIKQESWLKDIFIPKTPTCQFSEWQEQVTGPGCGPLLFIGDSDEEESSAASVDRKVCYATRRSCSVRGDLRSICESEEYCGAEEPPECKIILNGLDPVEAKKIDVNDDLQVLTINTISLVYEHYRTSKLDATQALEKKAEIFQAAGEADLDALKAIHLELLSF